MIEIILIGLTSAAIGLTSAAIGESFVARRRWRSVRRQLADAKSNLEATRASRAKAVTEAAETIAALRRQVDHLERMRQTGFWIAEQETALRDLKQVLSGGLSA